MGEGNQQYPASVLKITCHRTSAAALGVARLAVLVLGALVEVPQTIHLVVVQRREAHGVEGGDGQDVVKIHHGSQYFAGLSAAHDFLACEPDHCNIQHGSQNKWQRRHFRELETIGGAGWGGGGGARGTAATGPRNQRSLCKIFSRATHLSFSTRPVPARWLCCAGCPRRDLCAKACATAPTAGSSLSLATPRPLAHLRHRKTPSSHRPHHRHRPHCCCCHRRHRRLADFRKMGRFRPRFACGLRSRHPGLQKRLIACRSSSGKGRCCAFDLPSLFNTSSMEVD